MPDILNFRLSPARLIAERRESYLSDTRAARRFRRDAGKKVSR